jgi:hypothetical protein
VGPASLLTRELVGRYAVDAGDAHWNDRHRLQHRGSRLAYHFFDAFHLVALNIEQQQVGARRLAADLQLAEDVDLHEIERAEEKCAEAERQHHRAGLVGGTV